MDWQKRVLISLLLCALSASIDVSADQVTVTIPLEPDWDLVSIPVLPRPDYRASDLIADASTQGINVSLAAHLSKGRWEVHSAGLPFNDFLLEEHMGLCIYSSAGTFTFAGPSPFPCDGRVPLQNERALLSQVALMVTVDVLANDPEASRLISWEADTNAVFVFMESPTELRLVAQQGFTGTVPVQYIAAMRDGSLGEGELLVEVETWFAALRDKLEEPFPDGNGSLIEAYVNPENGALEPFAGVLLYLGDQLVADWRWGGIDPATSRMPIASATKWPAAMVALRGRDLGYVHLDDSIRTHLPSLLNPVLPPSDDTTSYESLIC